MKAIVNTSIWSDAAILPDRLIKFKDKEEFHKNLCNLLKDMQTNLDTLPRNRVGYRIKSNVEYKFTTEKLKIVKVTYEDLFTEKLFSELTRLNKQA